MLDSVVFLFFLYRKSSETRPRFGILAIFPVQEIKRNKSLIRRFVYISCTGNQENLDRDPGSAVPWLGRLSERLE